MAQVANGAQVSQRVPQAQDGTWDEEVLGRWAGLPEDKSRNGTSNLDEDQLIQQLVGSFFSH